MDPRALELLELPEILDRLAAVAASEPGKARCLALAPAAHGAVAQAQPQVTAQVVKAQVVKAQVVNSQVVKPQIVKAQLVQALPVTTQRVSVYKISILRKR